jgi:hypothetical protein
MTKFLKGECSECRGHIEFPAEAAGTTADCPHCGKPTELMLVVPEQESVISKKTIVYLVVALLILGGGLVGAMVALNRAKDIAAEKGATKQTSKDAPKATNPFASQGFEASPVKVEKAANSALVYATGSVRNLENRQRFGVRIELELLNEGGSKVGEARDYQAIIETNGVSHYRAQVLEKKAVGARVVAIKEDQ